MSAQKEMGHRMTRILLIGSMLAPFACAWYFLASRTMPWWSDPGEWLKYANAIEAYIATSLGLKSQLHEAMLSTMWDQGVFQYPPLFFFTLIPLKTLIGPLEALKLSGSILFALQPLPAYFVGKKITGSRVGGIVAAYTTSLIPLNIEMLGWGGYPNLLGFLLLSTNIYFIISAMDDPSLKNICLMTLTSMLIPLAHHLTSIIHLGVLLTWIMLLALMKKLDGIKFPVYSLIAASATMALYRCLLAYPSQLITFNEAAYYGLRVNILEALAWAIKLPALFILTIAIAAFTIAKRNLLLQKTHQALLLAWTLFPTLATQGYLLGVAIDYNRVFFFVIQPVPLIVAAPFASQMKGLFNTPVNFIKKNATATLAMALSITVLAATLLTGVNTMANVAGWYSSQDPFGDDEKISALNWIKHNTASNSVFVADEYIGRWIEGYASRRTLLYMEPRFLYVKGQLERYYAASTILLADKEIRNGYTRILDQAEYNTSYAPIICFWSKGQYTEALAVDDSQLTSNLKTAASKMNKNPPSIEVKYVGENCSQEIEKTITVREFMVQIDYNAAQNMQNATVYINISRKGLVEIMPQQISINMDIGKIIVRSNSNRIERQTDQKIKLYFNSTNLNIQAHMENPVKNSLDETLMLEAKELVKEYNVSYIVIPALNKGTETLPEYQHLLKTYKTAYINDKAIILEARIWCE
jgi:hypothetical protein